MAVKEKEQAIHTAQYDEYCENEENEEKEENEENEENEEKELNLIDDNQNDEPYTDGRKKGEWQSRYAKIFPKVFHIIEALYLFILYVSSFTLIVLNYKGLIVELLNISPEKSVIFTRMFYCCISGLLGGTVFTTKWFYRSIARGYWNIDRIYWRLFTPLISLVFAFALGCILNESIIHGDGFSAASLGFLSGYFSDQAAGKMSEVATVLFQNTLKDKDKKTSKEENPESEGK